MTIALTVTRPFESYKPGDQITDEVAIQRIRAGEHQTNVVVVHVPPLDDPSNP